MNDGSISFDLYQFLATNFHQDWDLEADDWEGVVDNYVNEDPSAAHLRMLATEINDLLAIRTEEALREFLVRKVGVDYLPDPLSYRGWLTNIATRLTQRASEIDGSSGP
jgi:hypothetical protein